MNLIPDDKKSNPNICPICLEPWSSDNHSPSTLRCGHLFGLDCLKKWLTITRKCPTCNQKAHKSHIIKLYLQVDFQEVSELILSNNLQNKESFLKCSIELSKLKQELEQMKNYKIQKPNFENLNNSSFIEPRFEKYKRPQELNIYSSQDIKPLKNNCDYFFINKFPLVCGNSIEFISSKKWLIFSSQSKDHSKNSHGIQKWSMWTTENPIQQFIPLYKKPITSLRASPHNDTFLLSTSLDGTAKIILLETNQEMVEINPQDGPIWTCAWDHLNENLIYLTIKQTILVFDLRRPHQIVATIHIPKISDLDRIHTLYNLKATYDSDGHKIPSGLLVASDSGIYYVSLDESIQIFNLSPEIITSLSLSKFTSSINTSSPIKCISLSFDPISQFCLCSHLSTNKDDPSSYFIYHTIFELYNSLFEIQAHAWCHFQEPVSEITNKFGKMTLFENSFDQQILVGNRKIISKEFVMLNASLNQSFSIPLDEQACSSVTITDYRSITIQSSENMNFFATSTTSTGLVFGYKNFK